MIVSLQFFKKSNSFTLIESLIIFGIFIILTAITVPLFRFFEKETDLNNSTEEIINVLRLAQNKTLASEGDNQYGVHFESNKYVLFKGISYNPSATDNEIYNLSMRVEIYEIDLTGGGTEVIFDRITGVTSQFGKISLRLKDNISKIRQISINSSGEIAYGQEVAPADTNRLKDSRHVHFDYSRSIATSTEIIKLTLDSTIKEITIADYLQDGQIAWEGEVDVGGQNQTLKIHTHRLNNPDTQFCIHRDRRYNNKTLTIDISGEATGYLIQYNTNGQTSPGTSIYVSEPNWQ